MVLDDAAFPMPTDEGDLLFETDRMVWRLSRGEVQPTGHRPGHRPESLWRDKIVFMNRNRGGSTGPSFDVFDLTTQKTSTLRYFNGGILPQVSADGRWIHYNRRDTEGSDIMLVENFLP